MGGKKWKIEVKSQSNGKAPAQMVTWMREDVSGSKWLQRACWRIDKFESEEIAGSRVADYTSKILKEQPESIEDFRDRLKANHESVFPVT